MQEESTEMIAHMRRELTQLIQQRETLEIEADALRSQLLAPGLNGAPPAGLRGTPLVDSEGFPRADVDVYEVRSKRHRLALIDTDYKNLMERIEQLVKDLHAANRNLKPLVSENARTPERTSTLATPQVHTQSITDVASHSPSQLAELLEPFCAIQQATAPQAEIVADNRRAFALIDQVFRGSPAEEAGLREGDKLLAFGDVDAESASSSLQELVAVVNGNVGRTIPLVVARGGQEKKAVRVELVPHTWSGRGLLGCHLAPLQ